MRIDFVTLKEALSTAGELDEVGGPAYVSSLADGVPRATNIEYYARIVKEKATLRSLIYTANNILTQAYSAEQSSADILEQAERDILNIDQAGIGADFVTADAWVNETYKHLQRVASDPRHITGVSTGFTLRDRLTRGLQPGDLVILGARPSMGKTALALQIVLEAAGACDCRTVPLGNVAAIDRRSSILRNRPHQWDAPDDRQARVR